MERPINVNFGSKEEKDSFLNKLKSHSGPAMPIRPRPSFSSAPPTVPVSSDHAASAKRDSGLVVRFLDKVISLCLFMIFFGLPLFFTGVTLQGVVFDKQIYFYFWLLLALVSWAAKGVTVGEMNIRRTPLDIPIVGFWVSYLLATIFSVDRWHSFWGAYGDPSRGLMNVTALVIGYYLIVSHFNAKRLRAMMAGGIASGILMCLWTALAILNIKFLPDSLAQYAPISLSGSMQGIAIIISALVPLLAIAVLKINEAADMKKTPRIILTVVILFGLALDLFLVLALYNFIPWLALFIGVVIFLVFILSQIVRPAGNWTWLPMVIFVAVMALKMVGVVPIAKINFAEVKPLDWNNSLEIAKSSIKNKPILGSGPATYGYDFSMWKPQSFNGNMFYNLRFLQATGIVMEAVSTVGILGSFFLVVILLSFLSVELYLITKDKEKNKLLSLGLFSSSLIFLVAGVTTKVEGTLIIISALMGIMALAATLKESGSEEKYLSLSLKASPKFALALAFVFMVISAGVAFLFVFLGKVYVADVYAKTADSKIATDQDQALANMAKSIQLVSYEPRYFIQLGQYYMMAANKEAMKGQDERDVNKIQQLLNYSIAATRQGSDMSPSDISSAEAMAQIYENAGLYVGDSLNLALDMYKKGLVLEPHNPNFYLKIGLIKIGQATASKDDQQKKQLVQEAIDSFQSSVKEKDNFDAGYYQLSLAQSAMGDNDHAIENATKAAQINPQSADYLLALARLYQTRGKDDDIKAAEQIYKLIISQNDKDINAHFYLGLLYEKEKKKNEAKDELKKVSALLPDNSADTKKQIDKMISNIDAGIENTPQSLGLVQQADNNAGSQGQSQPAQ